MLYTEQPRTGLSQEAIEALVNDMHQGSREAVRHLVEAYLFLIPSVARRYRLRPDLDDLCQEGCLGLIDAAQSYQPFRGPFAIYAPWPIRRAINRSMLQSHPILSEYAAGRIRSARRTAAALEGGTKTSSDTDGRGNTRVVSKIEPLLSMSDPPLSLDAPLQHRKGGRLADTIESRVLPFDEQVALQDVLKRALHALPEEERQVVFLRQIEQRREADVAEVCGCTTRTVRNRYNRAVKRLREILVEGEC